MGVTAEKIQAAKARVKKLETECIKLEERKATAKVRAKEAKDALTELGFDPKTAEEEVAELYVETLESITALEKQIGI